MPVGIVEFDIHLPGAHSLKDRRMVVRSLKDRLRHSFNISICELDDEVVWQRARIGVAAISRDRSYLAGLLQKAADQALEILRGEEVDVGPIEILD